MSIVGIQFSSDCAPGLGWWCILHCLHPPGVVSRNKYQVRVTCHVLRDGRTKGHTHITLGDRGEDGDYDCVTRQQCSVTLTRGCDMLCARAGDQRPVTRYTVCHPYTGLWYHHCIAKSPLCILSRIFIGIFSSSIFLIFAFPFSIMIYLLVLERTR